MDFTLDVAARDRQGDFIGSARKFSHNLFLWYNFKMMFRGFHLGGMEDSIFRTIVLLSGWVILFWMLIWLSVSFCTWYPLSPPLFMWTSAVFDGGGGDKGNGRVMGN